MAYKIVWKRGGETAERYSSKEFARKVLKKSGYKGRIEKVALGDAGRTLPYTEFFYGRKGQRHYPKGKKLHWKKIKSKGGFVYRTNIRQ